MLATSPNQVAQLGCIPLSVHYFFCVFNKNVKTLQETVFHLSTECIDGLCRGNDLLSRENDFLFRGNNLLSHGNDFLS